LVFTTAVFGENLDVGINQFKRLRATKTSKIGLSTGESAKSG